MCYVIPLELHKRVDKNEESLLVNDLLLLLLCARIEPPYLQWLYHVHLPFYGGSYLSFSTY